MSFISVTGSGGPNSVAVKENAPKLRPLLFRKSSIEFDRFIMKLCYTIQGHSGGERSSDRPAHAHQVLLLFHCCLTSTEARWLIRDGDRVGRARESEGSTAETARKRPERPWTAPRTMEVLRRCPLAIAQRLVHCAIAVSTAVL